VGTTVVRATIAVTVNGIQMTRTTNDGISQDSTDAQKIWLPRTPTLSTTVLLGDTVTVSGLNVAGSVDFTLFGPSGTNAPDCSVNAPVLASFANIPLVNGTATTPSTTPVTAGGVYSWRVTYHSSDARNTDATTTCTSEVVSITYNPGQTPPPNP
jgi:hypothetical protein